MIFLMERKPFLDEKKSKINFSVEAAQNHVLAVAIHPEAVDMAENHQHKPVTGKLIS